MYRISLRGQKHNSAQNWVRECKIAFLFVLVGSEHTLNTLHDTVLIRVVGVILGRNLEDGGQKLLIVVQQVTDDFSDL